MWCMPANDQKLKQTRFTVAIISLLLVVVLLLPQGVLCGEEQCSARRAVCWGRGPYSHAGGALR
jgi:hypothetical protein